MNQIGVPFHLLVLGPFNRTDVVCTFSTKRMSTNPETEALVEEAWQSRIAAARTRGQSLFPGPMCRFERWSVVDGQLQINFGLTDYREFVGTNIVNPTIQTSFGEAFLANGTGVCSILLTADNQIIIQRRSQSVFEHPGMLNFCGGSLNPVAKDGVSRADPFEVMTVEFEEELGIDRHQIVEMRCLGLSRDAVTLKPDVLLLTSVEVPASSILSRVGDEHSELIAIANDPISLHSWVGEHWNEMAPSGLASLVAHIACMFATGMASAWEAN